MQARRPTLVLRRDENRYTTIYNATLEATAGLPWHTYGHIVIKPNFVSTTRPLATTHLDATRAVVDVIRSHTDAPITVAEGTATDNTWLAFQRYGYLDLPRLVSNLILRDLNADAGVHLQAYDRHLRPMSLQAARTLLDADLVVSVGPPKTHDFVLVTLSIKNVIMGGLISRFAPHPPGEGQAPRNNHVRPLPVRLLKAVRRLYDRLPPPVQGLPPLERVRFGFMARERRSEKFRVHQSYPVMHLNLFLLACQGLRPHVSVIDGWVAMEGDGPTDGDPVPWRLAIAGTDPVAVDAFTADLMGYPLQEVGYLYYCHLAGLGQGDVRQIRARGNLDPEEVRRPFRPHRLAANQRRWRDPRVLEVVGYRARSGV